MSKSTTRSESFQYFDSRNEAVQQDYAVEATFHYGDGPIGGTYLDDFEFQIFDETGDEITDMIKQKDSDLYRKIENDVEAKGLGADLGDLESNYDS